MLKFLECILILMLVIHFCDSAVKFIEKGKLDETLQISTSTGIVQGRRAITDNGVHYWTYQGIPYAKPPLDNLRFRAPESIKWKGVLDATNEQSGCVEVYGNSSTSNVDIRGQEDCLYLNIFTPQNPQVSKRSLPVLVWIYGGAFMFGNSYSSFYGPDLLLEQDMIVVTFNYRLGLFGFLSTEDVDCPGNFGLKDQYLVLLWIHKNIKNFGGDKNRVTVSGQSAGATSALFHTLFPKSRGLFQRVIANSGSPLSIWSLKRNPRLTAFDIGLAIGIQTKNSKKLLDQLRKVNVKILNRASQLVYIAGFPQLEKDGFVFGPVIEPVHNGAFLTDNSIELFRQGKFTKVPIMMGITTLEITLFWEIFQTIKPLLSLYDLSPGSKPHSSMNIRTPQERREAGLKIKHHYLRDSTYLDSNIVDLLQLYSDEYFVRPITKTAQLIYKFTPVYFYVFSYASEYGLASLFPLVKEKPVDTATSHLEDMFYIWKRSFIDVSNPPLATKRDKIISQRVLKLWKNFVHLGNPTPVKDDILQNIIWPPVNVPGNITYLNIDSEMYLSQNYRKDHLQFWDDLYGQYGHPPYFTY